MENKLIFLIFLSRCFLSNQYKLTKATITQPMAPPQSGDIEKTLQGAFLLSSSTISVFVQKDNIYAIETSNNPQRVKDNIIVRSILALQVFSISVNKNIIAFGDHLLDFVDDNFQSIGTPYEYGSIVQKNIVGGSVLDVYQDQLLLEYGTYDAPSNTFEAYLMLFNIDTSLMKFTLKKKTPKLDRDDEADFYFIDCKTVEKGATFICAYMTNDEDLVVGLINEEFNSFEAKSTILGNVGSKVRMVKLTENKVFLFYSDFDKDNNYGQIFDVYNRIITKSQQKTLWQYGLDNEIFTIAKKDSNSVFIGQVTNNGISVLLVSIFDFDMKFSSFDVSNIKPTKLALVAFEKGLSIIAEDNQNIQSIMISDMPECEDIYFEATSSETKVISLSQLTSDEDSEIISVTPGLGTIENQSSKEITYRVPDSGKDQIEYMLTDSKTKKINSKVCRIIIQICNPACRLCNEFSFDNKKTGCTSCATNLNYYPRSDDTSRCILLSTGEDGYFFSSNAFHPCHISCLKCDATGTDQSPRCTSCYEGFKLDAVTKQCKCDTSKSYWFDDGKGNAVCVETCPSNYPYSIPEKNECVVKCPETVYNKKYGKKCYSTCPAGTSENKLECKPKSINEVVKNIDQNILDLIETNPTGSVNGSTYQIYENTEEGKTEAGLMSNVSKIELGDCEKILKSVNGIPEDEPLLMFKLDISRKGQITNQVEYSVYAKNGTKLDLSVCENETIKISSPISSESLEEIGITKAEDLANFGYDMYNPEDPFYNDICTPYTTSDKTDIPLEDRKKDMYKNVSFCENNCQYSGINFETKRVDCVCGVKSKIEEEDRGFSFNTLGKSFTSIMSNSNLKVVKCYNLVFNGKKFVKNIGSWILLFVILAEVIILFIFLTVRTKPIVEIINSILDKKSDHKDYDTVSERVRRARRAIYGADNYISSPPIKKTENQNKTSIDQCQFYNNFNNDSNVKLEKNIKDKFQTFIKNNEGELYYFGIEKEKPLDNSDFGHNTFFSHDENLPDKKPVKDNFQIKENSIIRYDTRYDTAQSMKLEGKNYEFTDEELNAMGYKDAFEFDTRDFCSYYYSILKYDQLIIFTFLNDTDFNLKLLKIVMFLFAFVLYLTFNALFYSDSTMSHNYHKKGTFDFVYSLPKTIFSTLACCVINFLLKFLSLSQSQIQKIKDEKELNKAKQMANKMIKCLRIKIVLFFSLVFIFLFLFWYYIAAFCAVYINTQKNLFIDTLISFMMSMLYPFGICFFTACFRILGLRKKCQCAYGFSKILQIL